MCFLFLFWDILTFHYLHLFHKAWLCKIDLKLLCNATNIWVILALVPRDCHFGRRMSFEMGHILLIVYPVILDCVLTLWIFHCVNSGLFYSPERYETLFTWQAINPERFKLQLCLVFFSVDWTLFNMLSLC